MNPLPGNTVLPPGVTDQEIDGPKEHDYESEIGRREDRARERYLDRYFFPRSSE